MLVHHTHTPQRASLLSTDLRISQACSHLKTPRFTALILFILLMMLSGLLSGCDTGFGEPCTLPAVDSVQEACSAPEISDESINENGTSQSTSATCVLDNFPTCQTFLCLKYRGASPYCSLRCTSSNECEGGVCCPLLGGCGKNNGGGMSSDPVDPSSAMSLPASDPCADGSAECYCIRKSDL